MRSFTLKVLLLLAGVLTALPAAAQEDPARAVIQRFQENLLAVMKEAKSLGVTGRYQRLPPSTEEAFHLPLMIRVATGPLRRKAGQVQRSRRRAVRAARVPIRCFASPGLLARLPVFWYSQGSNVTPPSASPPTRPPA